MAQRPYVVEFYARVPKKGEVPELTLTINAYGMWDAHVKAAVQAKKEGVTSSFVSVRRE